jgi:tRNA (cytidine/uridine-2'-O-)-methyltransferase
MPHPVADFAATLWRHGYNRIRLGCKGFARYVSRRIVTVRRRMRLALFEPDIPQNVGAMLRLGACLGVPIDVIEPCGFAFDPRRLRRVALDYIDHAVIARHSSWQAYRAARAGGRLVLLTTAAPTRYCDFDFRSDDTLMVGRESVGAPEMVHDAADARVRVPIRPGLRSLNVASAAAMVLGEALRQTRGFPGEAPVMVA